MNALTKINIPGAQPFYRGKVRDLYDLGDKMVMVTSDRLSAFDVVFNEGIPDRGKILTRISNHWFSILPVKNHILETDVRKMPSSFASQAEMLSERTTMVKKCKRIDFECIVRGYLMGSAYAEYKETGMVSGEFLPSGLMQGSKLPWPIFTPSTKADTGHDINITYKEMEQSLGQDLSEKLRDKSLEIFTFASQKLSEKGIILADTKFEFGIEDNNGENEIILIDEVLTPDSSRYWRQVEYEEAIKNNLPIPSMDKQIVRDYLNTLKWDKNPPPPSIPDELIEKTKNKYLEIEKVILCITREK
ncbi:MAG: phosphoribosylaminoimidazolesuccinocarboxamide synthase [Spirochaetia bacterium]|nr:phosphoribosylaminoimidazolesuccinocarboxamide synthase [Spirochaetia bacterium]